MSKYQYEICGKKFNSKQSVKDYVRSIMKQYGSNVSLIDQHKKFMTELLKLHTEGTDKIGVGVRRMWLQRNKDFPTKGFWLERLDGTKTDFSFVQCLDPATPTSDFKRACRTAIAPRMIDFKDDYFLQNGPVVKCPVSGRNITKYESHVDHAPPNTFDKIVNAFIVSKNININEAPIASHHDGKIGNFFVDADFEKQWVDYHNEHAALRILSAEANLSLPKI